MSAYRCRFAHLPGNDDLAVGGLHIVTVSKVHRVARVEDHQIVFLGSRRSILSLKQQVFSFADVILWRQPIQEHSVPAGLDSMPDSLRVASPLRHCHFALVRFDDGLVDVSQPLMMLVIHQSSVSTRTYGEGQKSVPSLPIQSSDSVTGWAETLSRAAIAGTSSWPSATSTIRPTTAPSSR